MESPEQQGHKLLFVLAAVGAVIGLGKLLQSDEPMTIRKAAGHGVVSGGLGASATLLMIPIPDVPLPVLVGCACALASIGASALTLILQKYIERK